MASFGETFKYIAKGFAQSGKEAGKALVKGIPTKQGISSDVSKIKSDIKGYQKTKPVTFGGAFSQVIRGSQVPQAGAKANFSGRDAWKVAAQKKQEQKKTPAVEPNLFTMSKKFMVSRQQSAWYFNEYLKKNPGLKMKLLKYNPKTAGESDISWAKRIQNEWYGKKDEYASPYMGKIGDYIGQNRAKPMVESRIKRVLEPAMRKELHAKEKERDKLNISTLRKFTGYEKK